MKVRILLAAITRQEASVEVEVPDNISNEELDDLVKQTYDESESLDWTQDPEYWEKGHCYWVAPLDNVLISN